MASADVAVAVAAPAESVADSAATAPATEPSAIKVVPTQVAGIDVEHMNLQEAYKQLGMTEAEYLDVMSANKTWPWPGAQDGWTLSHNAIRLDMELMRTAIQASLKQVSGGKALAPWQCDDFKALAKAFYHQVHSHHGHEEKIFFPWMNTKVQLPPKMASDHKTLMAQLDKIRDVLLALSPSDGASKQASVLTDLLATFESLRSVMREHLEEEEVVGLPMMRKHFTPKEVKVPEAEIIKDMSPADMAWFMRPMASDKVRLDTMTRFGIPGLVQKLIMMPAVRKDEDGLVRMYKELADGEPIPRKSGGCFSC